MRRGFPALLVVLAVLGCRLLPSSGAGAFTIPAYEASTVTTAPEGGWVWFGAPRAVRNGDTTIFGYTTGGADVKAALIDNDTLAVTATTMLYEDFLLDDHQPPSFVVRPDGIIMAAFAYHVGELYVAIGDSAGELPDSTDVVNITSQVGEQDFPDWGYTYASILYLPDEDRYYIFARWHDPDQHPHVVYTYSDDDGATWAAHTIVANITYHLPVVNGTDRIDLVLSDHPFFGPNDDPEGLTSVYHLYYESGSGWHQSDGTSASTPVAFDGATVIHDAATARGWLWDIAVDGSGNPVVAYIVYTEPYPSGDWTYWYARWTGSAWDQYEVADAGGSIYATPGENDYAGGIVLDHESTDVVYYSSNSGGSFQVYRAVTTDGGATWTPTQMTSDADKNVRPTSVQGHDRRVAALFLYGTYTDYFTYSQGVKAIGT